MLPQKILAGTFHKSGTSLIRKILQQGAAACGYNLWMSHSADEQQEPAAWDVCFHNHSRFPQAARDKMGSGFVVVRDPRDIIISGMHYHCKAKEEWLHAPREEFGGATYQQTLLSLTGDDERYIFELKNAGGATIRSMLKAKNELFNFHFMKYEDLAADYHFENYRRLFVDIGLSEVNVATLLDIAKKNSIFAGGVKPSLHVRDGRPAQWRETLSVRVLEAYEERFSDAARVLGYA